RTELQRSARAADAGGAQKGVSVIDCGKGMNKLKAAKAMVSMCHRSCLPAPARWSNEPPRRSLKGRLQGDVSAAHRPNNNSRRRLRIRVDNGDSRRQCTR